MCPPSAQTTPRRTRPRLPEGGAPRATHSNPTGAHPALATAGAQPGATASRSNASTRSQPSPRTTVSRHAGKLRRGRAAGKSATARAASRGEPVGLSLCTADHSGRGGDGSACTRAGPAVGKGGNATIGRARVHLAQYARWPQPSRTDGRVHCRPPPVPQSSPTLAARRAPTVHLLSAVGRSRMSRGAHTGNCLAEPRRGDRLGDAGITLER